MQPDVERLPAPTMGVIYICTGEKYIRAGMSSARTVRKWCPGLPVHLFADWPRHAFQFDVDPGPFTSVTAIEASHRMPKVDYMSQSPYDWTLYLDTDTALRADIRGVFRLLERFDIAMAHAHHRHGRRKPMALSVGLPLAFPDYNTGVIVFRKSDATLRLLTQWQSEFHRYVDEARNDQIAMRHSVWSSDVRVATLPPEYNVRYLKYHLLWSKTEAATKIFHLRLYHVGWYAWLFRPLAKMQMRIERRVRAEGLAGLLRGRRR
ncbi:MAG TPA: putative nucleotide-diphospho-sugar transferase [Anaerolineales bacterium]|nr:putative nucleotide-diphospho-sugar transferase [Anaerolineales bacterium]